MASDEQQFATRMTCETARSVVLRRLAQATGLRRAVELAEETHRAGDVADRHERSGALARNTGDPLGA
jgi:hypothetical protein